MIRLNFSSKIKLFLCSVQTGCKAGYGKYPQVLRPSPSVLGVQGMTWVRKTVFIPALALIPALII